MTEAGYSPVEIVRSATVDAAALLGLEDTGMLAEGLSADIVGISGQVKEDPLALTAVRLVVAGAPSSGTMRADMKP